MWSTVESGSGSESGQAAPCARGKHSATLVGGHVYVLGGRGAGGAVPLRDFWRYTLATGVWERLECRGEPPPSLQEHSATAHEGRLFVFGGEAGAFSNETPLWIYDTETQVWRKLPGQAARARVSSVRRAAGGGDGAAPRGRRGHSAHALRDCLLIYGGYKDLRGSTDELWAFHYESESWQRVRTSTAGPARHRHAGALHGARLYVHAGRCDLRPVADLWHYDTLSRVWSAVRGAGRGPGARSGHAAARAGAHLYIFGGEAHGHSCNDMWRFHFASETWERILPTVSWPAARVDACALLVGGRLGRAGAGARVEPRVAAREAGGILRELSRLSSFHIRRAARCSYSALAGGGEGERDSTESLVRQEAALAKSHSAYVIHRAPALPRERTSVPDLAELPPADTLLCLEAEAERERPRVPHSVSVRFSRGSDDAELSTSDYASAERVGRAEARGFSNPHYLGPDVRALGLALTPDSGLGAGDIELQELGARRHAGPPRDRGPPPDAQLHLLLVGGKEPPHVALLQSPLSMWAYRLL